MSQINCRNCKTELKNIGNLWACQNCRSSFVDFSFLQTHFSKKLHDRILFESKNMTMTSQHCCALCELPMATHILFSAVQIESCYGCKLIWFDAGEIRKLQSVIPAEKGLKIPGPEQFHTAQEIPSDSLLVALAKKQPFLAMVVLALICFILLKSFSEGRSYRKYRFSPRFHMSR